MRYQLGSTTAVALVAIEMVSGGVAHALPPAPPTLAETRTHLKTLKVAPPASEKKFSRKQFGTGWASLGEGCDVRERVIIRDGRNVKIGKQCHPTSGRWRSVYDGKIIRQSRLVDIDHVVPLAEAWRSGAERWDADERERFANDLTSPQLVAVSFSSNRSKGDQDPAEWRPPRRAVWCLYARWWIDVKFTWHLRLDKREKQALIDMLATCRAPRRQPLKVNVR